MGTTVFERRRPAASVLDRSLAATRRSIFWLDDLPDRPARPPLTGDRVADLVIVGGGYTGLWTALLARRREPDARIAIVEARTVGWAASGRNGGFCEASLTHGRDNGVARWPEEIDTLDRLGMRNLDAMGADLAEWGIDAEWERVGALSVATEPHQLAWLDEWAQDAAARGEGGVLRLDAAQVQASVASPTYLGAVFETRSNALVHPGKLAAGLARAAEERSVEIFERSPVRRLETTARGVDVITETGRISAGRAVLATNVFPSLLKRNALMTVPVYDYVLMTEPLTAAQRSAIGWHERQGLSDVANQFHYFRQSADGRILFGGYDAVYHYGGRVQAAYEERAESFRTLASHFFTMFPQLEGLQFTHRWAGAIDTCSRFCAFFGTARAGRVAYAAGFTGLGVAATRFAGEVMLDLLDGVPTERTSLRMVRERPLPFPPEPAAAIGINATRWSLDRADHQEGRRNVLLRTLDALGLGFES
ncbi:MULTISPECIES: FAD-dependent oxidoreductase [unclassified Microbacterium]|uniref:NAD(P)/FAD-dependent oxidoreductase n=1 Tax=unclassified Microbacterium TaxID=2609290 RepID=UPI00214C4C21|nr:MULTISPECIES: FAD-dependent oxidoreductase [unclassified Microbacterium]MCR2808762.1 FAD-binding oxidoreductase [Microbacterium sp. zg.B185]WIM20909.1 FAD-dependent oxidoreductase [Microbacterium sp. zg-B185]